MPEALARIRREPTLSAPAREPARSVARTAKAPPRRKWRIWAPRTVGGYAGIFMTVALLGIVINAVGLQRERHPAPLFAAPEAAPAASPGPAPTPTPAPSPSATAPSAEAVAPPAAKPAAIAPPPTSPPAPARKTDPIGDLVRSDNGKTVLSVQRGLIKLGYDLQADGLLGATTLDALHDFEKTHGLPVTSDMSPRLIAKLNGAAR